MTMDELIIARGINKMPENRQQEILTKLYAELKERIGDRLERELNDDQKQRFMDLVNREDSESLKELEQLIPNYDELVQEEIAGLAEDLSALDSSRQ